MLLSKPSKPTARPGCGWRANAGPYYCNNVLSQGWKACMGTRRRKQVRAIATSRLTSKSQATVPAGVRKRLNLKPGDTVLFEESEGGVLASGRQNPSISSFSPPWRPRYQSGIRTMMTGLTVTCKPFDVVAVPFPFTDRHASKRRPALALSSESFSADSGYTILARIPLPVTNFFCVLN
jgi:AbrB family looped-hinge helix DNA binding protein